MTNFLDISISNIEEYSDANINVIKRNGRTEPFNYKKLERVCLWATEGSEDFTQELIEDTKIKLHSTIKISDLFDQLITTAVNKISPMFPKWEEIAGRLQLMKIYKESYNISVMSEYPRFSDVLKKGFEHNILDKTKFCIDEFTKEEINEIDMMIVPERDYLFNYKALVTFYSKYCMNISRTETLELPQHAYMRVAMTMNVNENHENRLEYIKNTYDALSKHQYTVATPIILNAGTFNQQLSSCVLNTVDDDSHSILDTGKNLGIYSKFKGGTAVDISSLRGKGSYIQGNNGYSSGAVPFLKVYENIMKAWNQGSKRSGACCVYFNWWHIDVMDLLVLRSNGGTDENRARGLQYGIKINNFFMDAVIEDKDVVLFDPVDAEELIGTYGDKFEEIYDKLKNNMFTRKKVIKARDLAFQIFKQRSETGNIYMFHEENVNEASMLNRYIGSSNLCSEIVLPSRSSKTLEEKLITNEDGTTEIVKRYKSGEIALCNLSSINLERWFYLTEEERLKLARTVVRTLDNTVDLADYPVKEGKYSNMLYRYLGIGVMNYANYLALNKMFIDSNEALEETDKLFDELSYMLILASCELAEEKGKYQKFHESKWAKGILPIDVANENAKNLTQYQPNMKKWRKLAERIKRSGLRNAQILSIAPTSTSGKSINAIESIEPPLDLFYKEEGTTTIPTLVPNFAKNVAYYKPAFDCDMYALLRNAAVRQKWLDQSQSVNVYMARPDSLFELVKLHFYGFKLGMKTYYYLKQQKEDSSETCESCT